MTEQTHEPNTTCYQCPLNCGWHYDTAQPGDPNQARTANTAIGNHMDTHTPAQFLVAIARLRQEVEQETRESVAQDLEAQVWPHESDPHDDHIWEKAALIARTGSRHA